MATLFEKWQDALFMNFENLQLHFENQFSRELERGEKRIHISGSRAESLLAAFLSQTLHPDCSRLPHLVVVPTNQELQTFSKTFHFFNSGQRKLWVLPSWEVSPYSGLQNSRSLLARRTHFLWRCQQAKADDVFLASAESLCQRTLPFEALRDSQLKIQLGDMLPEDLLLTLQNWGYEATSFVEDVGQCSQKGGILDVYSPTEKFPVRIELEGHTVAGLRFFDPSTQLTLAEETSSHFVLPQSVHLIPIFETLWSDYSQEQGMERWRQTLGSESSDQREEVVHHWNHRIPFPGFEFALPYFYPKLGSVLDHMNSEYFLWLLQPEDLLKTGEILIQSWASEQAANPELIIRPQPLDLISPWESLSFADAEVTTQWSSFDNPDWKNPLQVPVREPQEFFASLKAEVFGTREWDSAFERKLLQLKESKERVFICCRNQNQRDRLTSVLQRLDWQVRKVSLGNSPANPELAPTEEGSLWDSWLHEQAQAEKVLHLVLGDFPRSERWIQENLVFLNASDLLGKSGNQRSHRSAKEEFEKKARWMSFGDLKPGDCVVHKQHGVGVYQGLKIIDIQGVATELLQIGFRDNDKLFLPVYRLGQIQKYSGHASTTVLDKLGGTQWQKTTSKVKAAVRDIANELLQLYALRQAQQRPPFAIQDLDFAKFSQEFPFEETADQERAIEDLRQDFNSERPMDRLICGDVGFGKTEVAMRAAFVALSAGKQVAVLAPTTVLTFQHLENFQKRFKKWPFQVAALNRFVSPQASKKTLADLKEGRCNLVIGTHRLLSKDVEFKDLGLLIVDEEQKFGVTHKEKLRKLKKSVDTLALSATPIPRTLNMSLLGIRDLSLINSPPADRLPTRTFVLKWNEDVIRKGILTEVQRGGQVYYIHNRIEGLEEVAAEIRRIVPGVRLAVAHGQQNEDQLEKIMVDFFHHHIDVLVCTAIVESGLDNPKANTMFIDQAQLLGLSQLYQLRGRVGRSKQRAYCYLLTPKSRKLDESVIERLKLLQDNSALGSGIRIAQYDLELRGAGEILGENQSGHVDAVGFELYQELLEQAIAEIKPGGEGAKSLSALPQEDLEPEINLRIPALIPDTFIPDVRMRLSYYKALTDVETPGDIDRIEEELKDQFGDLPEPCLNLLGIMLIRKSCKDLGIKDLSAGSKSISLVFTAQSPIPSEVFIELATRQKQKYQLTQDSRLNIRLQEITWPNVYHELELLLKKTPRP